MNSDEYAAEIGAFPDFSVSPPTAPQ